MMAWPSAWGRSNNGADGADYRAARGRIAQRIVSVPALKDADELLFESSAIALYLTDRYREKAMGRVGNHFRHHHEIDPAANQNVECGESVAGEIRKMMSEAAPG
jgi:hypothetical protein